MRSLLALSCVLATLAASSAARAAAPPVHHVCPDGLEVVVSEMHATPLVTVEVGVHAGAMVEDDTFSGVSHLYEHMFFKGNAAQPDQLAFLARTRELGMNFNGTTNNELVNYFFTTTSDHFPDQMAFMRDALVTPRFDPKELERERVVVTGEMDRDESQPGFNLEHAVEMRLYAKNPTRKWAIGKRSSVLAATVDMMRTLQKRYFVPGNSVLVVTGDVKAAEVFALADKLYAGWATAPDPFKKFPVPANPPLRASEVLLLAEPVEDFTGALTWLGPSTGGPEERDTYAADLLATALNDPGSRFQKALVDSGACVGASFFYSTQRHTGEIGVTIEAAPDKVDACVGAAVAELPRLSGSGYFTDEELRNAAHRLEVGEALDRETTGGRANALVQRWGTSSFDYDAGYVAAVKAVTRQGIAALLDRWVLGKPFVFGAMASQKQLDAGLSEARLAKLVGVKPPPVHPGPPKPVKQGGSR